MVIQILLSLSCFSIFCLMNRCQVWDGKEKAVSIKDLSLFQLISSLCFCTLIASSLSFALNTSLRSSAITYWLTNFRVRYRDCNQSRRTLTLLLLCILHPVCPGGTPLYGLYGDMLMNRVWLFSDLSVLNMAYNFVWVSPKQGI